MLSLQWQVLTQLTLGQGQGYCSWWWRHPLTWRAGPGGCRRRGADMQTTWYLSGEWPLHTWPLVTWRHASHIHIGQRSSNVVPDSLVRIISTWNCVPFCYQCRSDWCQMGQIWDFLNIRVFFVHFLLWLIWCQSGLLLTKLHASDAWHLGLCIVYKQTNSYPQQKWYTLT